MKYYHVDVFSNKVFSGNGLIVVFPETQLSAEEMQKITREFNQFETIFVFPEDSGEYPVRIFTVDEELDFAGHPMLGAAAVIHKLYKDNDGNAEVTLNVHGRRVVLNSSVNNPYFSVSMNQGKPEYIKKLDLNDIENVLSAMHLSIEDFAPGYPTEIVSTGLPYLLLPVKQEILPSAGIFVDDFEVLLSFIGAKFVYVFDPETLDCRTWDNFGTVEDSATGSAAGPLCAYLVNNGYRKSDEKIIIKQGRFTGRPSLINGWLSPFGEVFISGDVCFFSEGFIY